MRRWTLSAVVTAALLAGGVLSACDDSERVEQRVPAAAPLGVQADATERPGQEAPRTTAEDRDNEGAQNRGAEWSGERAGRAVVGAIERGWEHTKDTARQAGEALATATGGPDGIAVRIWEQTKDRAQRASEVMKETAAATTQVLDRAWQRTKDAAQRTRNAWGDRVVDGNNEAINGDEATGEVRL